MSSSPSCTFSRIISPYQAVGHQYQSSVEGWGGYRKAQYKARNFNMTVHNIHSITRFVRKLITFTNWLEGQSRLTRDSYARWSVRGYGVAPKQCMFMHFPVFSHAWLRWCKNHSPFLAKQSQRPKESRCTTRQKRQNTGSHHNRAKSLYWSKKLIDL